MGWRQTFAVFGAVGIVWAVIFYAWFRDDPAEKSSVNAAELEIIRQGGAAVDRAGARIPWRALLASRNLWAICLMYGCMFYGWYFYITWLPVYLRDARGMTPAQVGIWAGMPLLFGAFGCLLGGLLTDAAVRRYGPRTGRRAVGIAGLICAAAFLYAGVALTEPVAAVLAISLSAFANDLTLSSCWAVCIDTGKQFSGTVSGAMNTFGNLGGTVSPLLVGLFLERFNSWNLAIYAAVGLYLAGAALWLRIDATEPVVGGDANRARSATEAQRDGGASGR